MLTIRIPIKPSSFDTRNFNLQTRVPLFMPWDQEVTLHFLCFCEYIQKIALCITPRWTKIHTNLHNCNFSVLTWQLCFQFHEGNGSVFKYDFMTNNCNKLKDFYIFTEQLNVKFRGQEWWKKTTRKKGISRTLVLENEVTGPILTPVLAVQPFDTTTLCTFKCQ